MEWINEFDRRMRDFGDGNSGGLDEFPVSIKVRVDSGCYDRGCCPAAWEMIDHKLDALRRAGETRFRFEKHESGPEILAYVGGGVVAGAAVKFEIHGAVADRAREVNLGSVGVGLSDLLLGQPTQVVDDSRVIAAFVLDRVLHDGKHRRRAGEGEFPMVTCDFPLAQVH